MRGETGAQKTTPHAICAARDTTTEGKIALKTGRISPQWPHTQKHAHTKHSMAQ